MVYQISFKPSAKRELAKLPNDAAERIARAIDALASQPRPPGCKKLAGEEAWRVRIGDWRVVYQIHDARLVVLVVRVAHRRDVYR